MDIDGVKVDVGGKQDFIDNCDPDRMSFWEIDEVRTCLQYHDMVEFWYRIPGTLEDEGLVQILLDKEVVSMCEAILVKGEHKRLTKTRKR